MEELIANSYPGDSFNIVSERNGRLSNRMVILTNREGTTGIIKRNIYTSEQLGATFESISKVEKDLLGITDGVKVTDYKKNGFFSELLIPKGFIITQINDWQIKDPKKLAAILENIRGRFDVIGIDNDGRRVYYPFRR